MSAIELGSTTLFNDANLLHYYKLEDTSDSKGSATLTNNNSTTFTSAKFNNGANFGTSGNKTLSNQSSNLGYSGGAYSISFWVKLNQTISSGLYDFADLSDTTSHTLLQSNYQYNSGTPQIHFSRTTNGITTQEVTYTVTLDTTTFHNIVLAYDGSTITAYFDGVSRGTVSASGNGNSGNVQGFVLAGQNNSLTANNGLCIIDDCALFNRNLTSTDVNLIYNGPTASSGLFFNQM